MTKEEAKIIIEYTFLNADGHLKPLDFDYGGGKGIVEALRMAIEALSQPSPPSNLDEAADTFNREDAARMWDYEGKTEGEIVEAAFKAGAEWQRESLSHIMLTYAADVFSGKMLLEDISYSYRQELAEYFRDLAREIQAQIKAREE